MSTYTPGRIYMLQRDSKCYTQIHTYSVINIIVILRQYWKHLIKIKESKNRHSLELLKRYYLTLLYPKTLSLLRWNSLRDALHPRLLKPLQSSTWNLISNVKNKCVKKCNCKIHIYFSLSTNAQHLNLLLLNLLNIETDLYPIYDL